MNGKHVLNYVGQLSPNYMFKPFYKNTTWCNSSSFKLLTTLFHLLMFLNHVWNLEHLTKYQCEKHLCNNEGKDVQIIVGLIY